MRNAWGKCPFTHACYLQDSILEEILTHDRINELLDVTFGPGPGTAGAHRDRLLSYIHGEAKKLFAILVCINQLPYINDFLDQRLSDRDLPVEFRPSGNDNNSASFRDGHLHCPPALQVFNGWNSQTLTQFEETQFRFLAPTIQDSKFRYIIHENCPLPVIERDDPKESFFSKVYKAKLDFGPFTQVRHI